MTEQYDVVDPSRAVGGGEYPTQGGFGWTNGVGLALAIAESRATPSRDAPSRDAAARQRVRGRAGAVATSSKR